jgi:phosphoserine phosphatase
MSYVLTFVASNKLLTDKHLKEALKIIGFYDIAPESRPVWLAKNKAADIFLPSGPGTALLAHLREELKDQIDIFILPVEGRRKKLLLADMDSTIVTTETLDELAGFAGIKEHIAAITQKAMEGKIDFETALKERVGLLKDLPEETLHKTLSETTLNPGAKELVATMKKGGATTVLVSGGFTFFTGAIAQQAGFEYHHGNTLDIENSKLKGTVTPPILDKFAKLQFLKDYCKKKHIPESAAMTIGDGANDLPMLKAAGFGAGYKPKDIVARELRNNIIYGDLSAALYAQGYTAEEIA